MISSFDITRFDITRFDLSQRDQLVKFFERTLDKNDNLKLSQLKALLQEFKPKIESFFSLRNTSSMLGCSSFGTASARP